MNYISPERIEMLQLREEEYDEGEDTECPHDEIEVISLEDVPNHPSQVGTYCLDCGEELSDE